MIKGIPFLISIIFVSAILLPGCLTPIGIHREYNIEKLLEKLGGDDEQDYEDANYELLNAGDEVATHLPELLTIAAGDFNGPLPYPGIMTNEEAEEAFPGSEAVFGGKLNRTYAACIIGNLGVEVKWQVVEYLDHEDPVLRAGALYTLPYLGELTWEIAGTVVDLLPDEEPLVRLNAANTIYMLYPLVTDSLQNLLQMAGDEIPQLRAQAAWSLSRFTYIDFYIHPVLKLNRDEVPQVRAVAAKALGCFTYRAETVVPALTEMLDDENKFVRVSALESITGFGTDSGPAMPILIDALDGNHPDITQVKAFELLGNIGPYAGEAVPAITEMLSDEDVFTRIKAARTLGEIGNAAKAAVPPLMRMLDDAPTFVEKDAAVVSLGKIGSAASEALPKLRELAKDDPFRNPEVEYKDGEEYIFLSIAFALTSIDPKTNEGIPILLAALDCDDHLIKNSAIKWLGNLGPVCVEAIDVLINLLDNPDVSTRLRAARALGEIGRSAESAIPKLKDLTLNDQHYNDYSDNFPVREEASRAIERISPGLIASGYGQLDLENAIEALDDDNFKVRRDAIRDLGNLGELAADVVPTLLEILKYDPDPVVRSFAAGSLGKLYPFTEEDLIPQLIEAATYDVMRVRESAVMALMNIGTDATDAIPIINEILEEFCPDVNNYNSICTDAALAIIYIRPESVDEKTHLEGCLKHDAPEVRRWAMIKLADLGPENIPVIGKMLEDSNPQVREEVIYALGTRYGKSEAILPYLIQAFDDESVNVRLKASYSIIGLGPAAVDAMPVAIKNLKEGDPISGEIKDLEEGVYIEDGRKLLENSVRVLRAIGPPASIHVPVLIEYLSTSRSELQKVVMLALVDIGEASKAAFPKLAEMLSTGNTGTRENVAYTFGLFGPMAEDATPALIDALSDEDPGVRWNAATSLGLIGLSNEDILTALRKTADTDSNSDVRKAAQEALGKL